MTTEIGAPNPYTAVLTDLRAKRAEIDKTIKFLEELSGLKISTATGTAAGHGQAAAVSEDLPTNGAIDEGAFHGMSIVDATKKLLALRKRKMGNPEIARELKAGGLVLTSVDPVNTVGSVLTRRFNQVGDVVRVGRGTWGLKEWYPGRTFKTAKSGTSVAGDAADAPTGDADDKAKSDAYETLMDSIIGGDPEGGNGEG